MKNDCKHHDENQEFACPRCGSPNCDGLKNCDICGKDTLCDKALCLRCEEQECIDEITGEPDFDPHY